MTSKKQRSHRFKPDVRKMLSASTPSGAKSTVGLPPVNLAIKLPEDYRDVACPSHASAPQATAEASLLQRDHEDGGRAAQWRAASLPSRTSSITGDATISSTVRRDHRGRKRQGSLSVALKGLGALKQTLDSQMRACRPRPADQHPDQCRHPEQCQHRCRPSCRAADRKVRPQAGAQGGDRASTVGGRP